MPEAPRAVTGGELKKVIDAARAGQPFLVLRGGDGQLLVVGLEAGRPVTIGRHSSSTLPIDWDPRVSRTHTLLEPAGADWVVSDDGLSRNGTFVNGERLSARRRLVDADLIRVGHTVIEYRAATQPSLATTISGESLHAVANVTAAQARVLVALCRPYLEAGGAHGRPASNREIAAELFLSIDAVKAHLRALFGRFELAGLPQNEKRLRLVERAVESGLVTRRDL